jgi:hypothetical protein
VQGELAVVAKTDQKNESIGRMQYKAECEAAINEQIKYGLHLLQFELLLLC